MGANEGIQGESGFATVMTAAVGAVSVIAGVVVTGLFQREANEKANELKAAEIARHDIDSNLAQQKFNDDRHARMERLTVEERIVPRILSDAGPDRELALRTLRAFYPDYERELLENLNGADGGLVKELEAAKALEENQDRWVVILGTYNSESNAELAIRTASTRGFGSPISCRIDDHGRVAVIVGDFPNKAAAETTKIAAWYKVSSTAYVARSGRVCKSLGDGH